MKKIIIYTLIVFSPIFSMAQETLHGMIIVQENAKKKGLEGVTIHWQGTEIGTITDDKGWFEIEYKSEYKKLVVSYVGYRTDIIKIKSSKEIHHLLTEGNELEEVEVRARKKTTSISYFSVTNTSKISSEELLKAACCNLSESFETNPSIDVNYSDAVTGKKQIQMLGLNSPYILIARENVPVSRGSSQVYELSFTPGTWVESIQVTKGAGGVVNGYEGIAGEINTELIKPLSDDRLLVNIYGSNKGRLEFNTHYNQKVSEKWYTGLYIHGNKNHDEYDDNNDNFLDSHISKQINVLNRWQYQDLEKGWISFINFRVLSDKKRIGEIDFNPSTDKLTTNAWGGEIDTKGFDMTTKIGYVYPDMPYQSFGLQTAYNKHVQNSYFGLRVYNTTHQSIYSNLLFNSIIGDTRNKFKIGVNFSYDKYLELVNTTNYDRIENSVGTFFEYSYDNLNNLSLVAGIRVDQNNKLGFFVTPRLHIRYDTPWEKGVFRGSIGRGKRSANIFVENQQLFTSNRAINIIENGGKAFGLDPETAWNYGASFSQGFNFLNRKGDIVFDFYRTDFTSKVVVDWENSQEISFYNLDGKSYANSFQTEVNYNILEEVDLRMSYKYYDIKTQYNAGLLEKPLTPKHRFFANIGVKTVDRNRNMSFWKFDATYNWFGNQRFPSTMSNPVEFQKPEYSKQTNLLNLQVTKVFSRNFEAYIGGENVTNVTQENPITSANSPFGSYFDSAMIYRPIDGGTYYIGLRYKLKYRF